MELTGTVQSVNFTPYKRDNKGLGFHAFVLKIDGGYNSILRSSTVMCKGNISTIGVGDRVKVQGEKDIHKDYGIQFKINRLVFLNVNNTYNNTTKVVNNVSKAIGKLDAIIMYLSSGIIKGIGESLAKRIVDAFGDDTFKIIDEEPHRLDEVVGISSHKAIDIGNQAKELKSSREIVKYLLGFGLTLNKISKIYDTYGDNTMEILERNPYVLITDIGGFSFKTVDKIAFSMGIAYDSLYRLKYGIIYTLETQANTCGNVYLTEEDVVKFTKEVINIDGISYVSDDRLKEAITSLVNSRDIVLEEIKDGKIVYIAQYYGAETMIVDKISVLKQNKVLYSSLYDNRITKLERELRITLSDGQRECVKKAMSEGVLVITGGAGTGKTTVINTIVKMLNNEGYIVELCAPTGRSAKRLQDATNLTVNTIHRLLGVRVIEKDTKVQCFVRNADNILEADVVIVDEVSMVDNLLMNNLLQALDSNTRLILVGDVNQLNSVGAGNVLKDIIKSGVIEVEQLKAVYRQSGTSDIVLNADLVNKGICPVLNKKSDDFFFIKTNDKGNLVNTILDLVDTRIVSFKSDLDRITDIQVLSPFKKDDYGTINLNKALQERLNPFSRDKVEITNNGRILRKFDKVMHIKNNTTLEWKNVKDNTKGIGVFNGDVGIIQDINKDYGIVSVLFDDGKLVKYTNVDLDELDLAYAITIHKSQGSEYRVVVIPIHSGNPKHLTRNLLYTGITRAKEMVILVGIEDTIKRMVNNVSSSYRNTYLRERLVNICQLK